MRGYRVSTLEEQKPILTHKCKAEKISAFLALNGIAMHTATTAEDLIALLASVYRTQPCQE